MECQQKNRGRKNLPLSKKYYNFIDKNYYIILYSTVINNTPDVGIAAVVPSAS